MLILQISESARRPTEIAEPKYKMYHYPDALVQKRFHSIYLKAIAPELNCQRIGLVCWFEPTKSISFHSTL